MMWICSGMNYRIFLLINPVAYAGDITISFDISHCHTTKPFYSDYVDWLLQFSLSASQHV